ncbi:MAG TPA: cation-translocating P-type ATPase [Kofleriaceae bacterium]|nr:cation-translocating P-type ATPase [Kofleriaceae bacterium]
MTKHRVLARRAAAIETPGAVTVLCVDKTGTLTENRMAIRRIVTEEVYEVPANAAELPESCHEAIELGLLACPRNTVDAMDRAFGRLAAATLATTEHVHPDWTWVREYPLSPGLLAVTHVWRADGQRVVIATKGAPEAIIDLCHLEPVAAALWRSRAEAMAAEGLRVLGVARAARAIDPLPANVHDMPFEIVGLVGLLDPLRGDTAATIQTCRSAGVRVIMITGDHAETARAIGRAAGLHDRDPLSGAEIETLDDAALAARLAETDVVARAAPAHKLRIIRTLRAAGEVVAMTGDGVNDAPALKAADVGIAMGQGTDVARESAGLVLLEPSLAAIAAAIRTGRTIYENLRKVAGYLLAVHLPIAGLALIPPLLDWPLLLGPIHIVLLELVIDPTCSIVFEMEPPARDVMQRPPRGRAERLFAMRQVAISAVRGLVAFAGPCTLVAIAQLRGAAPETVRALGFAALIAADVALVVAAGARNGAVLWITLAILAVMAAIFAVPALRALFGFGMLKLPQVGLAALAAVPVLATTNWVRRAKIIKRP